MPPQNARSQPPKKNNPYSFNFEDYVCCPFQTNHITVNLAYLNNKLTLCEAIIMIYHGISSSCTKFLEKNIFIVEANKVYPLGTVLVAWTPQTICIYVSIGTTIRGLGLSEHKQTKKTPIHDCLSLFFLKKWTSFWTIPAVHPWFSNLSIPSKPAPQRRQMPRWRHCLHWWYTIQHGPAPAMRRLRSSGGRAPSPRA